MKPLQHAKISAKKHGGKWEDYIDIHEFFDQTKAQVPDMRHRAILHNSFGIFLARQMFGEVRTNSAGREYSVRDIGEDHVLEDLGTIPTLVEVINCIDTKHLKWLGGLPTNKRTLVTKIPKKPEQPEAPEHPILNALQDPKGELATQPPLEAKEAPEEAIRCQECGFPSPPGTHQALMGHEEGCSILEAAVDVVAKNWYAPDEDECVDGGIAYFRRHRAGVID